MKRFAVATLLSLGLMVVGVGAIEAIPVRTLPSNVSVNLLPCQTEEATYNFTAAMDSYHEVGGIPYLRLVINVQRQPEGRTANSRDVVSFGGIILNVKQGDSSIRVRVDGQDFVIEANYTDPMDKSTVPRSVPTTFIDMFTGGKVGLTVRTAN